MLTPEDLKGLRERGIKEEEVLRQYELLRSHGAFVELLRPCTLGDGVKRIPEEKTEELLALQEEAAREGRFMRFVPASGAASRMFEPLHRERERFLQELPRFPFYPCLDPLRDPIPQLERIANTPKALIPFHLYPEGPRTALEEHLVEASLYLKDRHGAVRVHFTVPPGWLEAFKGFFSSIRESYEGKLGCRLEVTFSLQSPSTDTIALEEDGSLAREEGKILFRPGGHGALVENLEGTQGDLVYIRNVDNIAPDRLKPLCVHWERLLGGYLVELQGKLKGLIPRLSKGEGTKEALSLLKEEFSLDPPQGWSTMTPSERSRWLLSQLKRPVRVCAVVPNQGQPGGGPFWVRDKEGRTSLQIVEASQVDMSSPSQREIWEASTYFNPVQMVCALRDPEGRPFRLRRFVDESMPLITRKPHQGRYLWVLERPGLWNGGMARWLTVFVEAPAEVFNPVKTCWDLLAPNHQP